MKHFVLDTNVLIHDPRAIFQFADNEVVIPIFVLEEVDQFKKEASERGRNAREVARLLDGLRANGARLSDGVPLPEGGGRVRVASAARQVPTTLRDSQIADHLILMVALDVRDFAKDEPTIFVTKDVNLRIRADALGLTSMDYEAERIDIDELYSGMTELPVPGADVDGFYAQGVLALPENGLKSNQYVLLRDRDNPSHSAIGRFDAVAKKLVPLRKLRDGVWGIRPRNKEQHYSKLLVSRPIFPLGRDVGYLPGDIEEKLNPWMQPIYDNVEFLMGLSKTERKNGRSHAELIDMGYIEIEPLTYIRGRSIPNQFIIVDEAQNLTPHEVKTIITRVGEATKVVLTGDPYQIDNPYVDATSNGLTTVVEKFKGEPMAGHVTLSKGERSPLAELASNVL